MGLAALLLKDPFTFLLLVVPLLYSVIAHEVAHGVVALWFGDATAQRAGRLTLNPLSHLDPIGSLMLFMVGFGWAKPVPVDYRRLLRTRLGMIAVALAGVFVNILLAAAALALLRSGRFNANTLLTTLLSVLAQINVTLAAFNLIPIPPLDGSKVVLALLPQSKWNTFGRLERYGFALLLLMILTGIWRPVVGWMQGWVLDLIRLLFH